MITLQGALEKSPWNEWFDVSMIISYFGGSNNIFADYNIICIPITINNPKKAVFRIRNILLQSQIVIVYFLLEPVF